MFTRLLDGVEPGVVAEITHAAEHVSAVRSVLQVRARWLGHRLTMELDVAVAGGTTVREAEAVAAEIETVLADHIPALASAHIRVRSVEGAGADVGHGHHHAPDPVPLKGALAEGLMEIVDTPQGERLRFNATRLAPGAEVTAVINRPGGMAETLPLLAQGHDPHCLLSSQAPAEPHEFSARLEVRAREHAETLPFRMVEPVGHAH